MVGVASPNDDDTSDIADQSATVGHWSDSALSSGKGHRLVMWLRHFPFFRDASNESVPPTVSHRPCTFTVFCSKRLDVVKNDTGRGANHTRDGRDMADWNVISGNLI